MTADPANVSTADLVDELTRRGAMPRCQCGKWKTYVGRWDHDGLTVRCHGCLRAIGSCRC